MSELPVLWEAVARDTAELLDTARRVRGYRLFLAHARSAKAGGRAGNIDREVNAQARALQMHGVRAAAATARAMRSLSGGGAFAHSLRSLAAALQTDGPVKSSDLWTQVRETAGFRPHLERHGIDDAALDEFGALLARMDLEASADGSDIVVQGIVDGGPVSGRIVARRSVGMPRDAVDLLTSGRFAALCDALERGEPAYLLGAGPQREAFSPEDLAMTATLASQRDSIRHFRKLEDVGLATQAGGEVVTVIAAIAIALFLIGIIISWIECEPGNFGLNDPDLGCRIGHILSALGFMVLLFLTAQPNSQTVSMTGQTISGPLPQLEG